MSLSIVVNGGGTFTASMEEGPVSFTASLAAVGPKGDTGPGVAVGGTTGQVLAKASGTNYDTQWVARNPFNQSLDTTDNVTFGIVNTTSDLRVGNDLEFLTNGTGINFSDGTNQQTALPSGLDDGYIIEWNADTSTYDSVPNDARTLFITARNITGTTIPKGSVVLITGASGNRPTIGLAQGNTSSNADGVIGITAAAINNNANGRVITEGLASNLDTSAFAAGDKLYLSAVTPGGLVNVRPVQPAHSVAIGVVTRSNSSVGSIEVRVQVGEHLEYLHDVLLTSNTNLDLLAYETSSGLWKNKSFSTLGLLTSATAASTYLTTSTAASTYSPIASPTFTGTVTIPAGASISGFAPLASPALTGTPTAPTAAATTNTTQVATTAFVQQEVPAASTTAAGKVELATDAEAVAGTSATLAVTPENVRRALMSHRYRPIPIIGWTTAASGTGASVGQSIFFPRLNSANAGVAGNARLTALIGSPSRAKASSVFNWSKAVACTARLIKGNITDTAHTLIFSFGKNNTWPGYGDLSAKGIAVKIVGSTISLQVHDGTNLTSVTASVSLTVSESTDFLLLSNGAGTVDLYVNDAVVATTTAGPTGNSPTNGFLLAYEIDSTSSSTVQLTDNFIGCVSFWHDC